MKLGPLVDKTIVVTGSATGLGLSAARALVGAGATVALVGRTRVPRPVHARHGRRPRPLLDRAWRQAEHELPLTTFPAELLTVGVT